MLYLPTREGGKEGEELDCDGRKKCKEEEKRMDEKQKFYLFEIASL
jgi:hypothetical protein